MLEKGGNGRKRMVVDGSHTRVTLDKSLPDSVDEVTLCLYLQRPYQPTFGIVKWLYICMESRFTQNVLT